MIQHDSGERDIATESVARTPALVIEEPLNLMLISPGRINTDGLGKKVEQSRDRLGRFQSDPVSHRKETLLERGREQAELTGEWIRGRLGFEFEAAFVDSAYSILDTATIFGAKIGLDIKWMDASLLSSEPKAEQQFAEMQKLCGMKNVLLATSAADIISFRSIIERTFSNGQHSRSISEGMPECGVVHYSRQNPETGEIASYLKWRRLICPWNLSIFKAGEKWEGTWQEIERTQQFFQVGPGEDTDPSSIRRSSR